MKFVSWFEHKIWGFWKSLRKRLFQKDYQVVFHAGDKNEKYAIYKHRTYGDYVVIHKVRDSQFRASRYYSKSEMLRNERINVDLPIVIDRENLGEEIISVEHGLRMRG